MHISRRKLESEPVAGVPERGLSSESDSESGASGALRRC